MKLALSHIISTVSRAKLPNPQLAWRIAVHEAGHALTAHLLDIGDIKEMSLKGDGGEILIFRAACEETVQAFDNQIAYCLAGRAAEIIILGDASGGAGGGENSDLAMATAFALQMERSRGLGLNGLLWEPIGAAGRGITEGERQKVCERLETQSVRAQNLLKPYSDSLTKLARALVDQGYLTGEEVGHFLPNLEPWQNCA